MHKAETILAAIASSLAGLATTGANVKRGRSYAVPALPGLSIFSGADTVADEQTLGIIHRELEVFIESHVEASEASLETDLNQIRAEVFAALRANPTLGGAAIDISPVIDERPVISEDADRPIASQIMLYHVYYRHSAINAEV